jgi:hypothetical protein
MICRHEPGDPNCTRGRPAYDPPPATPDAAKYEVLDAQQIGRHLVMRVKYPNCFRCEFEGVKILVFGNVTAMDALKWKRIDPHFRNPNPRSLVAEAPSPWARFPGTDDGWADALAYAQGKP